MQLQMMQINYKKNLCMLTRCYDDVFIPDEQRNVCAKKCAYGQEKFSKFVETAYGKLSRSPIWDRF